MNDLGALEVINNDESLPSSVKVEDLSCLYNQQDKFVYGKILGLVETVYLCKVVKVYDMEYTTSIIGQTPKGVVDVMPLVEEVDTLNNSIANATIYQIPYLAYHAGSCAVQIKPHVGDIGIAVVLKKDSDNAIKLKSNSVSSSNRYFNRCDSVYLMSIDNLTENPQHFIKIDDSSSTEIDVETSGNVYIKCNKATIDSPITTMTGNCTIQENCIIQGSLNVTGNITGSAEVIDILGSMNKMRLQYNAHTHTGNAGRPTSETSSPMD